MQRRVQLPVQHACTQRNHEPDRIFVITKQTQIKAVGCGDFPPDVTRLLTFSSQAPANEVSHDEPRHPETFLFFPFQLGWLLLRSGPSWSSLNKGGL